MGVATDLAIALDPVVLAHQAGIEPDGWQADLLRSTAPRILLNASRQSGKSTTTATLAVWTALCQPGALVLLLSPSLRQSSELFKKCLTIYRGAGRPAPAEAETALALTLESGSRIVSLPGKEGTVRGFSGVALLVIDEASRVPDDLYTACRPMLAVSGGRLIALSTPNGKRGWWHAAWETGGASWRRVKVTADQCPRISPQFLEEERLALGAYMFGQEYYCEFADTVDAVFSYESIHAALSDDVRPLFAEAADRSGALSDLARPLFPGGAHVG